jgi:hypothetical protein
MWSIRFLSGLEDSAFKIAGSCWLAEWIFETDFFVNQGAGGRHWGGSTRVVDLATRFRTGLFPSTSTTLLGHSLQDFADAQDKQE